MRRVRITTIDNPFDPFDDFTSWFLFDVEKGYYSTSNLARLTETTDDMTNVEKSEEIERAIDRMIEIDPLDIYIKVVRED